MLNMAVTGKLTLNKLINQAEWIILRLLNASTGGTQYRRKKNGVAAAPSKTLGTPKNVHYVHYKKGCIIPQIGNATSVLFVDDRHRFQDPGRRGGEQHIFCSISRNLLLRRRLSRS